MNDGRLLVAGALTMLLVGSFARPGSRGVVRKAREKPFVVDQVIKDFFTEDVEGNVPGGDVKDACKPILWRIHNGLPIERARFEELLEAILDFQRRAEERGYDDNADARFGTGLAKRLREMTEDALSQKTWRWSDEG